jgi:hypothetical protein
MKKHVLRKHAACALSAFAAAMFVLVPSHARAGQIEVSNGTSGEVVITAKGKGVTIRKITSSIGSATTVTSRGETATFTLSKTGVSITRPDGRVIDNRATEKLAKETVAWLRSSSLVRDGRALLASLDLKYTRFADGSLLLTHALLNSLAGDAQAANRYREGLLAAIRMPKMTLVSFQGDTNGPGWCWDMYSKEAIKIAREKDSCYADLSIFRQILPNECDVIYIVQAEGAFFWYLRCAGIGIAK